MTASAPAFFSPLTNRAPEFRDRFRPLHIDGKDADRCLTVSAPRSAQGFWTRLVALGPIDMARTSYRSERQARQDTVRQFKRELRATYGDAVANRIAVSLRRTTTLTLHKARDAHQRAQALHRQLEYNWKAITSVVNGDLSQAPGREPGPIDTLTPEEVSALPWTQAQRERLLQGRLILPEALEFVTAFHKLCVQAAVQKAQERTEIRASDFLRAVPPLTLARGNPDSALRRLEASEDEPLRVAIHGAVHELELLTARKFRLPERPAGALTELALPSYLAWHDALRTRLFALTEAATTRSAVDVLVGEHLGGECRRHIRDLFDMRLHRLSQVPDLLKQYSTLLHALRTPRLNADEGIRLA